MSMALSAADAAAASAAAPLASGFELAAASGRSSGRKLPDAGNADLLGRHVIVRIISATALPPTSRDAKSPAKGILQEPRISCLLRRPARPLPLGARRSGPREGESCPSTTVERTRRISCDRDGQCQGLAAGGDTIRAELANERGKGKRSRKRDKERRSTKE